MSKTTSTRLAALLGVVGILAMIFSVTATTATAQETPEPVVEAARQVTADPRPARLYAIPTIEVSPADPETVVVGAAEARFGGCKLYVSRDGGLTWLETAQDMLIDPWDHCIRRPFGENIDLAFTPDGETLYAGFGASDKEQNHPNGPMAALFARTDDLGLTVETTTVAESGELQDTNDAGQTDTVREQHEMATIAVDPNDPERVYRSWRRQSTSSRFMYEERPGFPRGVDSVDGLHTMIATSGDGGETWSEPTDLTREVGGDDLTADGSDLGNVLVADDGTVYVITRERRPRGEDPPQPTRILLFTSTDQGESWEMSEVAGFETGITVPDAELDPETGDIHVVYEVERPHSELTGEDAPSPLRVEFITSSDGGETWSDPVDVIDPEAIEDSNQYFPGIDVAPNGRIDVAWWDFRDDPFFSYGEEGGHDAGERYAHIYWSYSTDGGRTWSTDRRVSDRLIDTSLGVAFPGATRGPIGVASTDDAAYMVWPDTRAGSEVNAIADAYMTRVRMQPELAADGGGGPNLVGMGLGAGGALALAGAVMLLAMRRRRPDAADVPDADEA